METTKLWKLPIYGNSQTTKTTKLQKLPDANYQIQTTRFKPPDGNYKIGITQQRLSTKELGNGRYIIKNVEGGIFVVESSS